MSSPDEPADSKTRHEEHRARLEGYRALQRHPVWQVMQIAASGGVPSKAELDALELPAQARQRLLDAATKTASTRASGEGAEASRMSREAAAEIVDLLPEDLQDPDYLRPPEPELSDPAELAAAVLSRTPWSI